MITACATKSPLIKAAYEGDAGQVKGLLNTGQNVNERDSSGITPLMYTAMNGDVAIAELLLSAGALINEIDSAGYSALAYAIYYSKITMAKYLISKGADVNAGAIKTELKTAITYRDIEKVSVLLGLGVIAEAADVSSALFYKAPDVALKIVNTQSIDFNVKDEKGMTPLHYAAKCYGCQDIGIIADVMLQKGADPNIKDKDGLTPLRYTFLYNNIDVAAAIRRSPKGVEVVSDLSVREALNVPSRYTPDPGTYSIPSGREKAYENAVIDCNFLIARGNKMLLLLGGPVVYGGAMIADKVHQYRLFDGCMQKMGFKCLKNCKSDSVETSMVPKTPEGQIAREGKGEIKLAKDTITPNIKAEAPMQPVPQEKRGEVIAYAPKESIPGRKVTSLRSQPDGNYSQPHYQALLRQYNFFDNTFNKYGSFQNDFVDNGNGTITDRSTGLMWQKSGSSRELYLVKTEDYIKKLTRDGFAGYSDWRIPTTDEIVSLLKQTKQNGKGLHIDPLFDKTQYSCWSSDVGISNILTGHYNAWFVSFEEGTAKQERTRDSDQEGQKYNPEWQSISRHIRVVRSLQQSNP
jgi:ankyrin repeat protein